MVNNNTIVTITDLGGTVRNMTAYIDNMSNYGRELADIDVTSFADAAERFIAGIELSPEITMSGAYEQTGTIGPDPVFVNLVGTFGTLTIAPVGTASGSRRYIFQALVRSFVIEGAVKERVGYRSMVRKDGTVSVGTY